MSEWVEVILDIVCDILPDILDAAHKKRKEYEASEQYEIDQINKRDKKIKNNSLKELRHKRKEERKELEKHGHTGTEISDGFK